MSFFRSFWKTGSKHKKLYDEWALAGSQEPENDEHAVETTFPLKYLGSTLVENAASEVATAEAVKTILSLTKAAGRKTSRVSVSISERGIRVSNASSQQSLLEVSIYRISYCSADATHSNVFAFIATNQNETLECHAFLCPKRKVAQTVSITVAQMFNSAFQEWQLSQEKFSATQERATAKIHHEAKASVAPIAPTTGPSEPSTLPLIDLSSPSPLTNSTWVNFDNDNVPSASDLHLTTYLDNVKNGNVGNSSFPINNVNFWEQSVPEIMSFAHKLVR